MRNIFTLLVLAGSLFAQGERSELNGIVTDSTGAAIPGVTVTALETLTKVETRAVSTDSGVFRIPYLQPGLYKISTSSLKSTVNVCATRRLILSTAAWRKPVFESDIL